MSQKIPFYQCLEEKATLDTVSYCFAHVIGIMASGTPDPVNHFFTTMRLGTDEFRDPDKDFNGAVVFSSVRNWYEILVKNGIKINAILRDLYDYFVENDLPTPLEYDKVPDIVKAYLEFKKSVNEVSDEVSAEIDRLAEMSDEEFEAEMNKEEEDVSDGPSGTETDDGGHGETDGASQETDECSTAESSEGEEKEEDNS